MGRDQPLDLGYDGRAAVVSSFQTWMLDKGINKANGQHVVRFCADMWVAHAFPSHLSIPTVWAVLHAADAFTPRKRKS
jgi:hypothetical protein